IDLRLLAASAGSAACRVVDSPSGTPNALSCHASVAHEIPHDAVVQGLEVSRGNVLQHQLFKTQFTDQTLQLAVLLLEFLQPSSLIHLQTTVFLAPTVVALFCDSGILASQSGDETILERFTPLSSFAVARKLAVLLHKRWGDGPDLRTALWDRPG